MISCVHQISSNFPKRRVRVQGWNALEIKENCVLGLSYARNKCPILKHVVAQMRHFCHVVMICNIKWTDGHIMVSEVVHLYICSHALCSRVLRLTASFYKC